MQKTVDISAGASRCAQFDKSMPHGLCTALSRSVLDFPLRVMIVDNSGSMQAADGNRLVQAADGSSYRSLVCTRWQELSTEVCHVAELACALGARFDVHLLNPQAGLDAASVCTDAWRTIPPLGRTGLSLDELVRAIRAQQPGGSTPLTEAVMRIVSMIAPFASTLRTRGERVVVIIATDGLPNNRTTFLHAMHALQALPVWVVVRLCTDDDSIVSYWNDLDAQLEAPLEVLDDVKGEAHEVGTFNPWLTYGPSLHLARLFGLPGQLYDALDEVRLVPSQIKELCEDILGCDVLPEPQLDPKAFVSAVKLAIAASPAATTCDARSGRLKPWLDARALERAVGPRGCTQSGCAVM